MTVTASDHKEIVRRVSEEAFGRGNFDIIDEYFADDFVVHNPALPSGTGDRERYKEFIGMVRSAFPDLESTTEDLIAEGDRVVERHVATGTHEGAFLEVEPTGNTMEVEGITIVRFEDGRIVEAWDQPDRLGLMEQLGVIPALGD